MSVNSQHIKAIFITSTRNQLLLKLAVRDVFKIYTQQCNVILDNIYRQYFYRSQPNPTRASTQPMDNSALLVSHRLKFNL